MKMWKEPKVDISKYVLLPLLPFYWETAQIGRVRHSLNAPLV